MCRVGRGRAGQVPLPYMRCGRIYVTGLYTHWANSHLMAGHPDRCIVARWPDRWGEVRWRGPPAGPPAGPLGRRRWPDRGPARWPLYPTPDRWPGCCWLDRWLDRWPSTRRRLRPLYPTPSAAALPDAVCSRSLRCKPVLCSYARCTDPTRGARGGKPRTRGGEPRWRAGLASRAGEPGWWWRAHVSIPGGVSSIE
jgi:hypothetical protein